MVIETKLMDQLEQEQLFNEALIRMTVLLYQIDGKVTLTEQDYLSNLVENIPWRSGVVLPAFISQAIHESRQAIDTQQSSQYLRAIGKDLNIDPARAFEVAMEITEVDGKRSEEELELLSLLSNRILGRGLVA
ncbi:TerB family tellurite resistance protein [Agaribacter flavus]|uniref:TerB family tellurite resistance protein n=1 Tax=Agaribacter flavus TaxID=1902781 RepID=A0ABV7FLT3_9ALTE